MSDYIATVPWPAVRRFEGESFSPSAPASLSAATWHPKPLDECSEEELGLGIAGLEKECRCRLGYLDTSDAEYLKTGRATTNMCEDCGGRGAVPAFEGLRRDCRCVELKFGDGPFTAEEVEDGLCDACYHAEAEEHPDTCTCNGLGWVWRGTLEVAIPILRDISHNNEVTFTTFKDGSVSCYIGRPWDGETDTIDGQGETDFLAALRALANALGVPGGVAAPCGQNSGS